MKKDYHFPPDLHYDRTHHLWVRKDGAEATTGLDAIALDTLGELAYITIKPAGTRVKKGEPMGALEAAKMTGDLIAPLSGVIKRINNAAVQNPGIVNNDLYSEGWMAVIEPDNWDEEATQLVSGPELQPWLQAEIKRMETQGFDA